jgi:serine/threonine-protein kinase
MLQGGRLNEQRDEVESKAERKRRVGPFELERKLGSGGMGVVYLATYAKNGRRMAVKVLAPEMSADPRTVNRFLREMKIINRLRHENIVRYYGGGKDRTQHFYAMEYIDGGSIAHVLKKSGRLSWEQTVDYARQVALALEYAHNHGIVHRDLKPANLFLTKEGKLKLGDFGIARDTQATALTAAGRTVGTYAYMAPEQISGKPPVSRKTDLYALGCVMFEMLTGKPPFDAPTAAEMLFAHLEQEPPSLRSAALDCPIWLEEVVFKLLRKDPEERYYDALAVQVALDEVVQKVAAQQSVARQTIEGGASATVSEDSALRKTLGKKKKKRKKVPFYERIWFLAVCLALLVGAVAWAAWPHSDQTLFAQAERLMQSQNTNDWATARERYLEPLLARSPQGEFASRAREYIEQIDMDLAERQASTTARLGKEPRSEAERLYIEASRFEQFKDRITALERYRGMVELFKDREDDRPYVNLARKRIREIEESPNKPGDVISLVNDNLARADELDGSGQRFEAEKIWNGVVTLYGSNQELQRQVTYARARLRRDNVERTVFGVPKPAATESRAEEER